MFYLLKGFTWMFGFLIIIPTDPGTIARFVFALFFCVLNSTQGLHIFIVYILISKRRQQLLKEKILFQINDLRKKWAQKSKKNKVVDTSEKNDNSNRDNNMISQSETAQTNF